jgi:hypothetical protein
MLPRFHRKVGLDSSTENVGGGVAKPKPDWRCERQSDPSDERREENDPAITRVQVFENRKDR